MLESDQDFVFQSDGLKEIELPVVELFRLLFSLTGERRKAPYNVAWRCFYKEVFVVVLLFTVKVLAKQENNRNHSINNMEGRYRMLPYIQVMVLCNIMIAYVIMSRLCRLMLRSHEYLVSDSFIHFINRNSALNC